MKNCLWLSLLLWVSGCQKKEATDAIPDYKKAGAVLKNGGRIENSPNQIDWQLPFGLTHQPEVDSIAGKPVKFYIENPKCDPLAIAFYYGKYRPTDESKTGQLLALAITDNESLRPFYRWILDATIIVSDGALAEYPGIPARKYAEKFPEELFAFLDADTTQTRYNNWTDIISYSGFYENDDYKNPVAIRKNMEKTMIKNSSVQLKNRIVTFTKDCFPDTNKTEL